MPKVKKHKAAKERRKYCRCTESCTSKINRQNRLRHYRKANISLNDAPPSVTATESSEESSDEEKSLPTTVINLSRDSPEQMHSDGYLGLSSEYEDDAPGQDKVDKWEENEPDYEEIGMDIDEEGTGQGDFESERDELDDRGSEFDEWKEFDEAAEAGFLEDLSDSDMLSELDEMLELDDLAMDGDEAEGWANRQYSFYDLYDCTIKQFLIREAILNRRGSR